MSEEVLASVGELLMRLKGAGADVRWVKPEALHLTLKFLGEIAAG
ncbi:MAG: 2'-5' RNA ligase family protein, partial [Thermodesulfobacteriota bacterium]